MRISLFILLMLLPPIIDCHAQAPESSMIISAETLLLKSGDPSLVIFHVGKKEGYISGHIPGAQYISLEDISDPNSEELRLQLPPVARLDSVFEQFGVSDSSQVIIYFGKDWVTPAARVYFTLDYLGFGGRTSILNGGMPAWEKAGGEITTEIISPVKGEFTPHPKTSLLTNAEWIFENLDNKNMTIIDARDRKFYDGDDSNGWIERPGHIPGAVSIPFTSIVDDSMMFKEKTQITRIFTDAGVRPGSRLVTYCHIGQQASLLYFAARLNGLTAQLYDGSYEDWSSRGNLPVTNLKHK